jgi:site-specific DNA recombinase
MMETQYISNLGIKTEVPRVKVRYVLYARKSTESDEKQALSIESQVKEMMNIADRDGLEVVDIRRESHSAKESGQRPVFKELLEDLRRGRYTGILTWAPDRLSRNAGDLGSVVDLMDENKLIEIRTYGQHFKNSPNEKFLLMILCSQAKLENDNKSINVKRGLRTRCEMGLRPGPALFGYLNEKHADKKCQVVIDPERAHIVKQMFEKVAYEKWSGRKIYHWLKFDLNLKTRNGNKGLTLGNIYLLLQSPFYYGIFEYPVKSGNFYTGKHEPLITKELFDEVQKQLKGNELKTRQEKEFAFTKLMKCGLCGSGICADEKYKKLKNGSINSHIYYGCTKVRDKNCKCGYMNETDLIKQLSKLVDGISFCESDVMKKIQLEVTRYKKFQHSLLQINHPIDVSEIDAKTYIKFLLKEGTMQEKREIINCFSRKVLFSNKQLTLE